MLHNGETYLRQATPTDRLMLANLIHFENRVHRHLDWRPPLDWIGVSPFLLVEKQGEILAALACPPDPPHIAWVRLFAGSSRIPIKWAWETLWPEASRQLSILGVRVVAILALETWLINLIRQSQFMETHRVVMLIWRGAEIPRVTSRSAAVIRPMLREDLPAVAEIDAASFASIWQNSFNDLELAFEQSAIAAVAFEDQKLVGYQISTCTSLGGHLARLAVYPGFQGHGIGSALVIDTLNKFRDRGIQGVTVNTQKDNLSSLAVYAKTGFYLTGEEYPVFEYILRN